MPLSPAISVAKFIDDAADEIDVRIGHRYVVPLNVGAGTTLSPLAITTLRIANARLASGRLLMAQAQAAQDSSIHAYGNYLIHEADTLIDSIANSSVDLEGAETIVVEGETSAPTISNVDDASAVESFYGHFTEPGLNSSPVWAPGSRS